MPLGVLIILSVGGILGIGMLLHYLGLTDGKPLPDPSAITRAWGREFGTPPQSVLKTSSTGRAGLVRLEAGIGLVWAVGADTTARDLNEAEVYAKGRHLCVDLPDFGARHIRLRLAPDEAQAWALLIKETQNG